LASASATGADGGLGSGADGSAAASAEVGAVLVVVTETAFVTGVLIGSPRISNGALSVVRSDREQPLRNPVANRSSEISGQGRCVKILREPSLWFEQFALGFRENPWMSADLLNCILGIFVLWT
jgi:hypothetical protein